jgi:hypothetical protein
MRELSLSAADQTATSRVYQPIARLDHQTPAAYRHAAAGTLELVQYTVRVALGSRRGPLTGTSEAAR